MPEEIYCGLRITRQDLVSYYDEADYMIPQQLSSIIDENKQAVIKVVSDDRDVFVLLCSNFQKINWTSTKLYMDAFTDNEKLISINKSVPANKNVIPSLIALHVLFGCDSVPMFGIGKSKALKKTVTQVLFRYTGDDVHANLEDVLQEGKLFVAKSYGQNQLSSSEKRYTLRKNKTDGAKKSAKLPALRSLPPTEKALERNIERSHDVAIMWENYVTGNPSQLNPCEYGCERNEGEKLLRPTMLPGGIKIAPNEILQRTCCKCASP